METEGRWCDNASCFDVGQIGIGNSKVHSYTERRFYCTTCRRTFSADKGTFFETLRTPRPLLLDAVALLVERNSLRAISRIKHSKVDSVLHWLELAGQQGAAINHHFLRNLPLTQVQIDELWSFVKKNKRICNPMILTIGAMRGSGVRWPCPVACVSSRIFHTSVASKRRRLFWRPSKPGRTGERPCSPVISCLLTWQLSLPITAPLSRLRRNAAVVVRAKRRVARWTLICFTLRSTNDVSRGA